jgi:lysophospholipase L1-like esterase
MLLFFSKRTIFVGLLISIVPCLACGETGAISLEGKRTMFLGDSITNQGAYVSYIEYYLQKNNPSRKYDIISVGLSSETVSGLSEKDHPFPRPCVHERLERALDRIEPEIVAACYGMNDGIYHPQSPERMEAYRKGTQKLIDLCKSQGVKLVILNTPPPFDPVPVQKRLYGEGETNYSYKHPYHKYAGVLEDYTKWIMSLKLEGVRAVDFNTPLTQYLAEKRKTDAGFRFSGDGIHPSPMGHLMMAQVFLTGTGAGIRFEALDAEFKKVSADPLFKLVDRKRRLRSKGWLEYVGYTRGKTVKKDSVAEIQQQVTEMQEQIDEMRKGS